eukprot:scaffold558_cov376-Prasinococcus_capsulatus_cf.AAC.1
MALSWLFTARSAEPARHAKPAARNLRFALKMRRFLSASGCIGSRDAVCPRTCIRPGHERNHGHASRRVGLQRGKCGAGRTHGWTTTSAAVRRAAGSLVRRDWTRDLADSVTVAQTGSLKSYCARKGWIAAQKNVQDHAHRPHVARLEELPLSY